MNKKEFYNWMEEMEYEISMDKKVSFIHRLDFKRVIAIDVTTGESGIYNYSNNSEDDLVYGKAKIFAYAKLRYGEIPKIEERPSFKRVKNGQKYYCIYQSANCDAIYTIEKYDNDTIMDNSRFQNNNYFHTHERSDEVIEKIDFLLKIERLRDIYCPDYVPNWDIDEIKYYVYFNKNLNKYDVDCWSIFVPTITYFPTSEIAEKVCEELNKEIK